MSYSYITGLALTLFLAGAAIVLSFFSPLSHLNLSPLIWGVLIGLILGNVLGAKLHAHAQKGLNFCSKQILRLGVILYGFRITVDGLFAVGFSGLAFSLFVTVSTLLLGCYLGEKILKLDRQTSFLTAIGAAICGAAAVLAAESVSRAKPHQAAAAVGTVVLFGTLAMLLYPLLFNSDILDLSPWQYGFYTGATVHEVAHVLTAGEAAGGAAAEIAVIVKMTRVLLLAPVLIIASLWFNKINATSPTQRMPLYQDLHKTTRGHTQNVDGKAKKIEKAQHTLPYVSILRTFLTQPGAFRGSPIYIPWFVLGFIVCIGINSLRLVPPQGIELIEQLDLFLLTMAMVALGLNTRIAQLVSLGLKPFYLGVILFIWLLGSGFIVTQLWI